MHGLQAARRKNLEHTLRFGDDRLYDSEEISENDKAEVSIHIYILYFFFVKKRENPYK